MKTKELNSYWPLAVLLGMFFWLTIPQLNKHKLWQDEAETALIATSILKYGIPKGTDGLNYFSQQEGAELTENNTWRYHPWLSFYLTAPSIALFGKTTIAARLPSYLIGIMSLIFIYFIVLKSTNSEISAASATAYIVVNAFFLHSSTNSRYFMPLILSIIACLYFFFRFLNENKFQWYYLLSLFFVFHSHYLTAIILIITLGLFVLIFYPTQLKSFFMYNSAFVLLHIPYIFWVYQSVKKIQIAEITFWESFGFYWEILWQYFSGFGLLLILAFGIFYYFQNNNFDKKMLFSYLVLPLLIGLIALPILSFTTKETYGRYLFIILPILAFTVGRIVSIIKCQSLFIGRICLFSILFFGGTLQYYEQAKFPYTGPISALHDYFQENASETDILGVTYGNLPLAYYLPNKIIGAHQRKDWEILKEAKYIVIRSNAQSKAEIDMIKFCYSFINPQNYKKLELKPFIDLTYERRETPEYKVKDNIKKMPTLVVYERKN